MGVGTFLTSNGNRVNVGNCDPDGMKVNRWNDLPNDNIGLPAARHSSLCSLVLIRWLTQTTDRGGGFEELQPAAEHAANLVDELLERKIFPFINRSRIFRQADEDSEQRQLRARTL